MLNGIAKFGAVALVGLMIFVVAPFVLILSMASYALCRLFERLTAKRQAIG